MDLLYEGQDIPQICDFVMNVSRRRFAQFFCRKYGWTMKSLEVELSQRPLSFVTCKAAGVIFIASATKLEQQSPSHTTAAGRKHFSERD